MLFKGVLSWETIFFIGTDANVHSLKYHNVQPHYFLFWPKIIMLTQGELIYIEGEIFIQVFINSTFVFKTGDSFFLFITECGVHFLLDSTWNIFYLFFEFITKLDLSAVTSLSNSGKFFIVYIGIY